MVNVHASVTGKAGRNQYRPYNYFLKENIYEFVTFVNGAAQLIRPTSALHPALARISPARLGRWIVRGGSENSQRVARIGNIF
jgi:hypothetical protein